MAKKLRAKKLIAVATVFAFIGMALSAVATSAAKETPDRNRIVILGQSDDDYQYKYWSDGYYDAYSWLHILHTSTTDIEWEGYGDGYWSGYNPYYADQLDFEVKCVLHYGGWTPSGTIQLSWPPVPGFTITYQHKTHTKAIVNYCGYDKYYVSCEYGPAYLYDGYWCDKQSLHQYVTPTYIFELGGQTYIKQITAHAVISGL
jgi:hypothetical protein